MIKLIDLATYNLVVETAEGDQDHVTDAYIEESKDGDFVMRSQAQEVVDQYIRILGEARIELEEARERILELEEKVNALELDNGK